MTEISDAYCPESESALAQFVKGTKKPLFIIGGGTRLYRAIEGKELSTKSLNGIVEYEPSALTMVAQAGTPLEDITAVLDAHGQQLAFEPNEMCALLGCAGKSSTIGGVFAANASGPRRVKMGAARDYLLGVRFVDGQGNIIKNGGRVMKNVTGYDLVKLMAGSWGKLGILTEVAFKVLPKPQCQSTLRISNLSDDQACRVMTYAMGTPYEVSGAAHIPHAKQTFLRIEGFSYSVAYRVDELCKRLEEFGDIQIIPDEESATIWRDVRDVRPLCNETGNIWKISTKPTQGAELVQSLPLTHWFYDWSGGLIWASAPAGVDIRASMPKNEGYATLVRSHMDTISMFHPQNSILNRISAEIQKQYDPHNLFNNGIVI